MKKQLQVRRPDLDGGAPAFRCTNCGLSQPTAREELACDWGCGEWTVTPTRLVAGAVQLDTLPKWAEHCVLVALGEVQGQMFEAEELAARVGDLLQEPEIKGIPANGESYIPAPEFGGDIADAVAGTESPARVLNDIFEEMGDGSSAGEFAAAVAKEHTAERLADWAGNLAKDIPNGSELGILCDEAGIPDSARMMLMRLVTDHALALSLIEKTAAYYDAPEGASRDEMCRLDELGSAGAAREFLERKR